MSHAAMSIWGTGGGTGTAVCLWTGLLGGFGLNLALLMIPKGGIAQSASLSIADPVIRWFEDKYWLYTSHDEESEQSLSDFHMLDYHAYSSDDLTTWTDHGAIFGLDDVTWANRIALAPDIAYRNGTYYL